MQNICVGNFPSKFPPIVINFKSLNTGSVSGEIQSEAEIAEFNLVVVGLKFN